MQYNSVILACNAALLQYSIRMKSYYEQLNTLCNQRHINLRTAFVAADIPTSTFYRAKQRNDMRFDTAVKVLDAINRIYALKTASDH